MSPVDVVAGSVRAFSQSDKVVACCQDIQNAIDKARRDELASRYREGQGKEERNAERSKLQAQYSKALDELARTQREKNASIEEIAQMSQLLDESMVTIEQKDQEIDDMSEYTSLLEKDIDSKEKKIASLKQELDSVWDIAHESEQLQWRVKSLTEQLQRKEPTSNDAYPLEKMVSLPSSVADALQLATEAFPKKSSLFRKLCDPPRHMLREAQMKPGRSYWALQQFYTPSAFRIILKRWVDHRHIQENDGVRPFAKRV